MGSVEISVECGGSTEKKTTDFAGVFPFSVKLSADAEEISGLFHYMRGKKAVYFPWKYKLAEPVADPPTPPPPINPDPPTPPPPINPDPSTPTVQATPSAPSAKDDQGEKRSPFLDNSMLWFVMIALATVFSLMALAIGFRLFQLMIGVGFGVLVFLGIMLPTIIRGWTPVPENCEYRIQINGKDIDAPFREGLHLQFPWLGFSKLHAQVYMGMQIMQLFLDETITKPYSGAGDVEFKDLSAPVIVKVFFKITDSFKATYNIGDVFRGIEEKMDERTRLLLGSLTFDQANSKRKIFTLSSFTKDLDPETLEPNINATSALEAEFSDWGIEVKSVSITDIILPDEAKKQREKVLEAAKNLEIAKAEADRKVALATGTKEVLRLEGLGFQEKIKAITATGVDPATAQEFLAKLALYDKVDGRSLVIESAGGSMAGVGAMFGAGFKQANQDHPNKEGGTK